MKIEIEIPDLEQIYYSNYDGEELTGKDLKERLVDIAIERFICPTCNFDLIDCLGVKKCPNCNQTLAGQDPIDGQVLGYSCRKEKV